MEGSHRMQPNYVRVGLVLFVLTMVEVGVTYMLIPHWLIVLSLLALMAAKAALVALFYMHLKFDNRLYAALFGFPLFLLGIPLVLSLIILFYLLHPTVV